MNEIKTHLDSIRGVFTIISVNEQEEALKSFAALLQDLNNEHYRNRVQEEATKSERFSNDWTGFTFPDTMGLMGDFGEPESARSKTKNDDTTDNDFNMHGLSDTISFFSSAPKYKCFSCEFVGKNRKALYRHGIQNDHQTKFVDADKSRAFTCQLCNFSSNRKFNLDRHIQRAHFSIRNHFCDLCPACFKDKDTLRGHTKNVHKFQSP
ncbi:unnamed protein product [Auanema sp. JU1783]|nr:unnamed protein product [Auanema sp. JU1783]